MKEFVEEIELLFSSDTLPVYVPGIDIKLYKDEIVYMAIKHQPTTGKVYQLSFVIRNGFVMIIEAEVFSSKEYLPTKTKEKLFQWFRKKFKK